MNGYQERVFDSFRREQGWFAANPQYAAGNPSLANQVDALNGIVSRLTDHVTAQDTQGAQTLLISKDETEKRKELLSHQMASIAQVARALRGAVPGIGVLSPLPKGNASTSELIAAATAMGQKAEIYKDVLVESGLPADFVDQLTAATASLKASFDGRGLARASRVAATRGVESEVALGRRTVAILDVVVTRLLRAEPAKLAEWKQLKRVVVKAALTRGRVQLVNTGSAPVQTSSTPVQTSSTPIETSSNEIAAALTTGAKAA